MRVLVANGLGNATLRSCLEALLTAAPEWEPDLHVIRERGTREATWNAGLDQMGRDEDVLFLGDDVLLTPGFREAVERGAAAADVVGLCTLDVGSQRVQDCGYGLARIDGRVTVEALERGRDRRQVPAFGVRSCDAVCGCLFFVKAAVLERVRRFRPEGMNRWGELIFALEARRLGARIAVVDHFVHHAGVGSKQKSDPALSSTSWTTERQLFERLVDRFVAPDWITSERHTAASASLERFLAGPGPLVLYGAGSVAETLLARRDFPHERTTLCSGLAEEAGRSFHGHTIVPVADAPLARADRILVTPLHRGDKIARQVLAPLLAPDFGGVLAAIEREVDSGDPTVERLGLREITLPA